MADAITALAEEYFLKEVIANNLNQSTAAMTNTLLWTAKLSIELVAMLIGYSAQIFADFGGYSLIAIGLGRLFGYELPINFHHPYFADSFAAFWRRWHISLSSWLRDYLYIPLGGNRRGSLRTYANLGMVMFLGGLWHGPQWKYAIWGLSHGIPLATERLGRELAERRGWRLSPLAARAIHPLRVDIVFAYVTLNWLLFRMPSVTHVASFLGAIVQWQGSRQLYTAANLRILWVLSALVLVHHSLSYLREKNLVPQPELALEPDGSLLALACVAAGKETAFIVFSASAPRILWRRRLVASGSEPAVCAAHPHCRVSRRVCFDVACPNRWCIAVAPIAPQRATGGPGRSLRERHRGRAPTARSRRKANSHRWLFGGESPAARRLSTRRRGYPVHAG